MNRHWQLLLSSGLVVIALALPAVSTPLVEVSPAVLPKYLGQRVTMRGTWTYADKEGAAIKLLAEPKTTIYVSNVAIRKTTGKRELKTLSTVVSGDLEQLKSLLKEGDEVVGTGKLEKLEVHRKNTPFKFFYMDELQISLVTHK
jgi:hypothetical protein